jgi:hypothetical protein
MTAIPFINLVAVREIYENRRWKLNKVMNGILRIGFAAGLVTTFFIVLNMAYQGYRTVRSINAVDTGIIKTSNYITSYEYEGLKWLKDNSGKNEIFSSNRLYLKSSSNEYEDAKYFYYTAFSERSCFLEGFWYAGIVDAPQGILERKLSVNNTLYSKEYGGKLDLARENHINYIVASKRLNPDFSISEEGIRKVFENSDIIIYRVQY